jgi:hypothetical protein
MSKYPNRWGLNNGGSLLSRLYYLFGFGWAAVLTLIFFIAMGLASDLSHVKIFYYSLSALWALFTGYRCWRWNKSKQKRLHSRAMLVYSRFIGEEVNLARQEGREVNTFVPIQRLLYTYV